VEDSREIVKVLERAAVYSQARKFAKLRVAVLSKPADLNSSELLERTGLLAHRGASEIIQEPGRQSS
jgi:hypothetical protein